MQAGKVLRVGKGTCPVTSTDLETFIWSAFPDFIAEGMPWGVATPAGNSTKAYAGDIC